MTDKSRGYANVCKKLVAYIHVMHKRRKFIELAFVIIAILIISIGCQYIIRGIVASSVSAVLKQ
jgi:hypothetical protein